MRVRSGCLRSSSTKSERARSPAHRFVLGRELSASLALLNKSAADDCLAACLHGMLSPDAGGRCIDAHLASATGTSM